MNKIEQFEKRLLAAGREAPVDDSVPFAFEKRVMARIRQLRPVDAWSAWGAALWRGLAPCLGIVVVVVAWNALNLRESGRAPFASALEATFYAPVEMVDTNPW